MQLRGSGDHIDSVVVVRGLSGPVVCGIFLDQGQTCVPCIGRKASNHWTTRKVLDFLIMVILTGVRWYLIVVLI